MTDCLGLEVCRDRSEAIVTTIARLPCESDTILTARREIRCEKNISFNINLEISLGNNGAGWVKRNKICV